MQKFEITITVGGVDPEARDLANRFHQAGCDDALLGVVDGVVQLHFDRKATTLDEAIASATRSVEAVGARVVEVKAE